MNKQGMAQALSQQFGFTHREAGLIVEKFFNVLTDALSQGRRVELRGLGTFTVQTRKASVGRVVRTGAKVQVPSQRRVAFRAGQALKQIQRSAV